MGQSPFSPLLTLPHEDEVITIGAPASHKLKLQQYGRFPFLPDLLWDVSGNKYKTFHWKEDRKYRLIFLLS